MLPKKALNILLIVDKFVPEVGAAAIQYYELGKQLSKRGHKVSVLTTIPRYTGKKYVKPKRGFVVENIEGIETLRIWLPEISKRALIKRGLEHLKLKNKLSNAGKKLPVSPDIILVYSPPLHMAKVGSFLKKHYGVPVVLNVQDLFPKEAVQMGLLRNMILIKYFEYLEMIAYREADAITVHSDRNADHVISKLGSKEKVFIVENWVDIERIKPGPKDNDFSRKYKLIDKFVVSFAGTIGFAQDVRSIIEAANILKDHTEIVFIIVGNGARKNEAKQLIEKLKLKNFMLLPPVPPEQYPLVLHSSDVSLATLVKTLKTPVVPSKIVSIMAAGKPVIASIDLESDAHVLIKNARCGISVPPENPELLANAILKLYKNKELRDQLGYNGRKYVEEHLSSEIAAQRYEKLFLKLLGGA